MAVQTRQLITDLQVSSDSNTGPRDFGSFQGSVRLDWLWRFEVGTGGTDDSAMKIEVMGIGQVEIGATAASLYSISELAQLDHPAVISHNMISDSGVAKVEYHAGAFNYWSSVQINFDFVAGGTDPKPFKVNLWVIGN